MKEWKEKPNMPRIPLLSRRQSTNVTVASQQAVQTVQDASQSFFSAPTLRALALGGLTGLRTFSPAALLVISSRLAGGGATPTPATTTMGRRLAWLRRASNSRELAIALSVLSVGEAILDKTPYVPARIKPGPLAGRIVSGMLVGATVSHATHRPPWQGAALGAAGAAATTFGAYYARRALDRATPVPDVVWGLAEDGLVAGLGALASGVVGPAAHKG